MNEVTEKLRHYLHEHGIPYEEVDHPPAENCLASATARGEDLSIGGKTILFKNKKGFHLFVLSAAKKIDNNRVRKILKSQKVRFASKEELYKQAGVVKGALPPFGRDFLPFDLYLDQSILDNDRIAFNAGVLTKSFIIKVKDYLSLGHPIVTSFSY
jgi:Ala-tRNA(Pro) deacylase